MTAVSHANEELDIPALVYLVLFMASAQARTTMLLLRKPSPALIRAFQAAQAKFDLTYSPVGATAASRPAGYVVDRTRIRLGEGEAVFRAAKAALERWDHFRLGWAETWPPDTAIRAGEVVAVVARSLGLWWLNACRVVYVVEEKDRFGFAYGTLPDHAESGEERFLVEWDRADGWVWYDILAFSRPRHLLARLGYPWTRRVQKEFARDSVAAMVRAVGERLVGRHAAPRPSPEDAGAGQPE